MFPGEIFYSVGLPFKSAVLAVALFSVAQPSLAVIIVTQTTTSAALGSALGGSGLTITSVAATNGDASQFGTYTNFSLSPVVFSDGIVLSTGSVIDTPAPVNSGDAPSTSTGAAGTSEFDNYGPGNIENFGSSNDVARLQVDFTLSAPSAVAFDFIFGSVEYPVYTSNFTDAFLAFLDGTSNQIVYDTNGNPVQVGVSFSSELTTADQNTAFASPHGLLRTLTTTTDILSAGTHTLFFEIGDVNDSILDSAVFISNFRTTVGGQGTTPQVPVPAAAWLLGSGLIGLLGVARRKITQ